MAIKIALAGNPNCGKTTMFNDLTGSNQYVGNWPGVTVEKKEGRLRGAQDVIIQDLPGIYSLSPYTLEEVVARGYLVNEKPDAILNIVDATNIERNLYLTTQLSELGIPMVVALNMIDVTRKNGDRIDMQKLGAALGCQVVATSALRGEGSVDAAKKAAALAQKGGHREPLHVFNGSVEHALAHIEDLITHRDGQEPEHHHHADGSKHAGSIVEPHLTRWYAIKLFERDEKVMEALKLDAQTLKHIEQDIAAAENECDDDAESIITNERYLYIASLMKACYKKKSAGKLSASDKIDKAVTNRFAALPIFAAVMFLVYWIAMGPFGSFLTDWTNDVFGAEILQGNAAALMESWGAADWLSGLVVDGIIGGVGAVLGFVPQLLVLFLMLCILEDVGYMARVAFIMDRIFRKFGLSGKSFIPMLVGTGCGVPGVMASRTIENERDRRMTIMTTCFIPCGAKMPIVGMLAGALFGGSGLVAVSAYFIGVAAIIISGIMLKKTRPFTGEPAPFVMELPAYHVPAVGNVLRGTWERGWSFIKKAGTIILLSAIVLWFLQGFGIVDGRFTMVEDNNSSLLATIGRAIAFIFTPLGFGDWQSTVATVTGLIAKENVVTTFGVVFHVAGEVAEDTPALLSAVAAHYTALSAYSFMIFNLLCAPCFAAMGAIKREMNNAKWTWAAIGYMCVFAYAVSLIVYQFGAWFIGSGSVIGTIFAVALLAFILYMLFRPYKTSEKLKSAAYAA